MSNSTIKIQKIKSSNNVVHEIDAKYWGNHSTDELAYINGEDIFSGGNINPQYIEIKYNDLVDLRNNGELIPGRQYRITDYITTTSVKYTKSAGNKFDIIVTALDKKTLSEEAKAIKSETANDSIFQDSNFSAWKIWYSLDNDTNRFEWAGDIREDVTYTILNGVMGTYNCKPSVSYQWDISVNAYEFDSWIRPVCKVFNDPSNGEVYENSVEINEIFSHWSYESDSNGVLQLTLWSRFIEGDLDEDYEDLGICPDRYHYKGIYTFDGKEYDVWTQVSDEDGSGYAEDKNGNLIYILTDRFVVGTPINNNVFGEVVNVQNITPKGVIYRMIDEYNNDCPYDFKNIQFLRKTLNNRMGVSSEGGDKYSYCYTFSWENENEMIEDASCNKNYIYTEVDGEEKSQMYIVQDNSIKAYEVIIDGNNIQQHLNNIVFFGTDKLYTTSKGCYSNHFEINCYNNTFGCACYGNVFGNFCVNNILNNNCYNNTFGNNCNDNVFGDNCYMNIFGNNCYMNTFGNNCNVNVFGNNCYKNTFGDRYTTNTFCNNCYNNTFGNKCYNNTFGSNCYNNTFGNTCYNNTFDSDCFYNTFGNTCYNNTFDSDCFSNTFGNSCYTNTFGNRCYSNVFDGSCNYNTFGSGCHTNTFGNTCTYNNLDNGCTNNIFDKSCYTNTLGLTCQNNKFGENCGINILGNNCGNNIFNNDCDNNILKNNCSANSLGDRNKNNNFGICCRNNILGSVCYNNTFGNTNYDNILGIASNNNSFGNNCIGNTLDNTCNFNSFGNGCVKISLGNKCSNNNFGNKCAYISFRMVSKNIVFEGGESNRFIPNGDKIQNIKNVRFGDGCSDIVIYSNNSIDGESEYIRNINVSQGLFSNKTQMNDKKLCIVPEFVEITTIKQTYETMIAKNSSGVIKTFCLADFLQ